MNSMDRIEAFRVSRFEVELPRTVADWRVAFDTFHLAALELRTDEGFVGLGFFGPQPFPGIHPPLSEIERRIRVEVAPRLLGEHPAALLNRPADSRPAHGPGPHPYSSGVDMALWDLSAQIVGLPLFRLLGGTDPVVPLYASGVDFRLDDPAFADFYATARDAGFTAFKVKVGGSHDRDLARVRAARDIVGAGSTLMIDANEAWPPKEALLRLESFEREGSPDLFWVEDPCRRDDLAGTAFVRAHAPTRVNVGEFLDLPAQRRHLEAGACDVLNLRMPISHALASARLATEYAVPVTFGNSVCEVGAHVAAAVSELTFVEYSFMGLEQLVAEPYPIAGGMLVLPERPGHGLVLSDAARAQGESGAWIGAHD